MKGMIKKMIFPVIGFLSLIWFLIRVIPKPNRVSYPCMRAAAPIASSFVLYILGLFSTVFVFKKARKYFNESRYVLYTLALFLGIILTLATQIQQSKKALAYNLSILEDPNQPMGEGKGVNPGRVAWIYDPDATDSNCTNSVRDYWYQDDNTDQTVVSSMLSQGLQKLTGQTTDAAAWDAIFHYHNQTHSKGDVGYTAGEKIAIKINLNGMANWSNQPANINTSPQICYTMLDQLVHVVGVAQADIGIGDPSHSFNKVTYDKCHPDFPDVEYWGDESGRTPVVRSEDVVLFASSGEFEDWLPQAYLDAAYMINIPVLKKHHRAGISLACKNHFGSISAFTGGAWHLHPSLPCPDGGGDVYNGDYGVYRCFVDIMGHEDLGDKTILYLVDGIWSSINWGHPPIKWRMEPFNDDWPSSIFLSQDPVAIESVGFDFLYNEFDENHPTEGSYDPSDTHGPFSRYDGVDDYLHQAADSNNWAAGITYDPEQDGVPLPSSLGTHEHWNNTDEKKYSRNLGLDKGIDLASNLDETGVKDIGAADPSVKVFSLAQNYPNPFNPMTTIRYRLSIASDVSIDLYNTRGEKIRTLARGHDSAGMHEKQWDGLTDDGSPVPSGAYYYRMTAKNDRQTFTQSNKMLLCR